jgi:glucose-6-phosphate 1-dehydrogenase
MGSKSSKPKPLNSVVPEHKSLLTRQVTPHPHKEQIRKLVRTQTKKDNDTLYFQKTLVVVVVGASGDLAKKKTYPSLLHLFNSGYLPKKTQIIGYARSSFSNADFRERLRPYLDKTKLDNGTINSFLASLVYMNGTSYDDSDAWAKVDEAIEAFDKGGKGNRMFYFAIPPTQFSAAGSAINGNAMGKKGGWNRMVIEKPFGKDVASSDVMSKEIGALFTEDQIYRIDHYLGKEMVQNLLVLRFANTFLEPVWSRKHIKCVIISFKENIGTDGRGGYFDQFGIIRDVMQNHLLQILSLVAMEKPDRLAGKGYSDLVRDKKVEVLKSVKPLTMDDVILGQYVAGNGNPGYLDDETVPEGSNCPTYCLAKFTIDNDRWKGVPFIIKCGKALDERKADIRVQFKEPNGSSDCFGGQSVPLNELVMIVQPNLSVYMKCNVKMPGFRNTPMITEMNLSYDHTFKDIEVPDAYTRLLLEVLRGQQATFVRDDELRVAWKIFTPLLHEIESKNVQPLQYAFGSRGPREADETMKSLYERSVDYQYKDV